MGMPKVGARCGGSSYVRNEEWNVEVSAAGMRRNASGNAWWWVAWACVRASVVWYVWGRKGACAGWACVVRRAVCGVWGGVRVWGVGWGAVGQVQTALSVVQPGSTKSVWY